MMDKLPVVTIPLDRIEYLEIADDIVYQEYRGADLDDYFSKVVGVSVNIGAKEETIIIRASYPAAAYIETKPIHCSQTVKERGDDYLCFEYTLIPNYEFETILLGYSDECEVIQPASLRKKLHRRALKIIENSK